MRHDADVFARSRFQSHFKLLYEYSTLMLKSQFEHDFTTSVIAESDVRLAVNRVSTFRSFVACLVYEMTCR